MPLQPQDAQPNPTREQWITWLQKVSEPVLVAAEQQRLRVSMPVEAVKGHENERALSSPLEALGRLLAGLAPWLELDPAPGETGHETALRLRYRSCAQQAVAAAVDPRSADYMRFGESGQTLVDSAFLSLALLRAPGKLLDTLTSSSKALLVQALLKERKIHPPHSNWLLFPALNEILLRRLGADWNRTTVDYALREHFSWYVGDGTYGDGPHYHADYYNSFVIHPFLLAIADAVQDDQDWESMRNTIIERARRYTILQERCISSQGEYPAIGRSITYRAGAFHLLADMSLRNQLPTELHVGAIRAALTAVQHRTLSPSATFSPQGWLQIGLAGHQPSLAETYISTGSLYLCSTVWLPLGLPGSHPFWSEPASAWTQKRIWSGEQETPDHALES